MRRNVRQINPNNYMFLALTQLIVLYVLQIGFRTISIGRTSVGVCVMLCGRLILWHACRKAKWPFDRRASVRFWDVGVHAWLFVRIMPSLQTIEAQ